MTTATTTFKQVIASQPKLRSEPKPNKETIAAILEGDELARAHFARLGQNDIKNKDT
ncbi:hypothetical protein FACS1894216_20220 [Synergistales bacterium]|nr:hypothetical protein FACS1894216_20220 [Synergistales bacterium]